MKKMLLSGVLLLVVLTIFGACAPSTTKESAPSQSQSTSQQEIQDGGDSVAEGGVIGVVPKSTLYDYWKYVRMGAESAAEENGYSIVYQGTATDTDVEGQVKIIEDFITQGVKAIVISPVNEDALVPALQAAHEKGIVVIIIDGSLNADFPYATISTDDYAAGQQAANEMIKLLGDKSGKVAVVSYTAGSIQGGNREGGFVDTIEATGKLEVLNTYYSDGDRDKAFSITQDILTSNPDILGIYSTNEGSSVGVLLAIEAEQTASDVAVIGFDTSTEQINAIRSGTIDGLIAQNPLAIGYNGVESAVKVLRGEEVDKTVAAKTIYVNKDNIDSEEVQTLLTPPTE